jgi:hypothetical protein
VFQIIRFITVTGLITVAMFAQTDIVQAGHAGPAPTPAASAGELPKGNPLRWTPKGVMSLWKKRKGVTKDSTSGPLLEVGDPSKAGAVGSAEWYKIRVEQGYHRVNLVDTPKPLDWFRQEITDIDVPEGARATVLVVGKPKNWEVSDPRIESRPFDIYKHNKNVYVHTEGMNYSVPINQFPLWNGTDTVNINGMLYRAWRKPEQKVNS